MEKKSKKKMKRSLKMKRKLLMSTLLAPHLVLVVFHWTSLPKKQLLAITLHIHLGEKFQEQSVFLLAGSTSGAVRVNHTCLIQKLSLHCSTQHAISGMTFSSAIPIALMSKAHV
jgi:hypothetical protein